MTRENGDADDFSRRTFMKGVGATAGAAALGASATGSAAADGASFDSDFANWRVQEARKVWAKGYTGRPDRTVGITDSGISGRHPDLGPWNGVRVEIEDGEFTLVTDEQVEKPVPVTEERTILTESFSGQTAPGGGAVGATSTTAPFTVDAAAASDDGIAAGDIAEFGVDATISWNADNPGPQANDADFELQRHVDTDGDGQADTWQTVASSGSGGTETQSTPEESLSHAFEDGGEFRFYVVCWRGATAWDISLTATAAVEIDETTTETVTTTTEVSDSAVFEDESDKVFGWFDAGPRYGSFDEPRDSNGHGTHCASIMAGTGEASDVDTASGDFVQEEPRALLVAGDFLAYEVDVDADRHGGIFVGAYGDGIELLVEGPEGRTIEQAGLNADHSLFDVNLIDHPVVHDSGTETYTVYVRGYEGQAVSTGRVDRVAAGPLLAESEATGDRAGAGESVSLHSGVAPDAGLVGLQGLSEPTYALGEHADAFAETFNMRAVNMSWGYTGGLPLGAAGGRVSEAALGDSVVGALREIANGGILPVAAAGNAATPANGNGAPNVADEAISVAATDPVDGLTSYSAGGIGGLDEDTSDDGDSQAYTKPDVSAPGGAADGYPGGAFDLVRAAKNGTPKVPESEQDPIRDYTLKAGTSMAAPYVTGVAGLLADAMDYQNDAAPDSVALPEPAEADYDDAMRLKQVILATATETAFTAAPFHHPSHRPTYEFGGRDPYEGYGRVNPDAAVEAVTRDLFDADLTDVGPERRESGEPFEASLSEELGLNVPVDSRAAAGYVEAEDGTLEVDLRFDHYSGGNKGMAQNAPHLDLFVYDADDPATNGEPSVVAKAAGVQGSASVTVEVGGSAGATASGDPSVGAAEDGTFFVVAKLVNVPGAVNTDDVQAHVTLDATFTPDGLPAFTASGSRTDDGDAYTGGQTNHVQVTVSDLTRLDQDTTVEIRDRIPAGWSVDTEFADAERVDGNEVVLGTVTPDDVDADGTGNSAGAVTREYFAEAPSSAGESGPDTFGPATAVISASERDANDVSNETAEFGGTERVVVVGTSTEVDGSGSPSTSSSGSSDGTVGDATDSVL